MAEHAVTLNVKLLHEIAGKRRQMRTTPIDLYVRVPSTRTSPKAP